MAGTLAEATKENFRDLVADGTTLVDVWGPDCAPCLAMMPFIEQLADERKDQLDVVKLEAPKARRLCMELKVMGLPAFLLFRDGEEIGRLNGAGASETKVTAWLDEMLAGAAPAGVSEGTGTDGNS